MALNCVTCGAENPVTNRFCGQCGTQLARDLEVSAKGVSAKKEEEAGSEHLRENRGEELRERADNAATNKLDGTTGGNAVHGAPANSGATQPPKKYRIIIEPENTARTGFLGLSGDGTAGYEDDEDDKPASHLWRYIAVAVVAVAVVLAVWQWRSVRDYGLGQHSLGSMLDDVRQAALGKRVLPTPSAVAADSAGRTVEPPAKPDPPELVESSSSASHTRPAQQTGTLRRSAPGAATPNQSARVITPRAMGAPLADIPDDESPAVSKRATNFRESHPSDPAANLPSTALAGAYEMNRAAHAGDAEVRAMWLWKAVAKENPQAPVELARMYVQGSGVVRNCEQAQVLLRSAAKNGNEQARLSLQEILLRGGCSAR